PCAGANNWTASNDITGGTPGRTNSVAGMNPDNTPPMISNAFPVGTDSIVVQFDDPVLSSSLQVNSFTVDNGIGIPGEIIVSGNSANSVTLVLNTPLSPNIIYTLTVYEITDCSGNNIMLGNSAQFGIPESAQPGDILINEVLFNPSTGGYDYVELYNKSNKLIDLASLYIVELSIDTPDVVLEFADVSATGRLFFPHTYVLLTANVEFVANAYNRADISNFIAVGDMPNYPDDAGVVLLQTKSFTDIDRLQYTDDWHFALLEDENGVSLERITLSGETQNADSWHSAAALLGYGTPGYQNSNYSNLVIADNLLDLESNVFSPDGDGYQDLLIITYQTEQEGYIANIKIFDDAGRLNHTLINNETMAREGFITWDGVRSNGTQAPMGIYILYAEFFNLDGAVQKQRKKFTLIRKY
ncbi:MAG: lamin tail domain-containing protein, partial [Chitinophagales bacterium]